MAKLQHVVTDQKRWLELPFDIEQTFNNGNLDRANFLSRVFGIFNEEIVRIWCRDPRSPYLDLGRPTIRTSAGRYYTLDFALGKPGESGVLITEMKCEIAYDGFRYLKLESSKQLDHHRGKAAFDLFLEFCEDPNAHPVTIKGKEIEIVGSALVWGAIEVSKRSHLIKGTGLSEIISLEAIVTDLQSWNSNEFTAFISERANWITQLAGSLKAS